MKRFSVAIDLDRTLVPYERDDAKNMIIRAPYPGAVEFVHSLIDDYDVCIFSARSSIDANGPQYAMANAQLIAEWLEFFEFPKGVSIYTGIGKPNARIFFDDRAFHLEPAVQGHDAYARALIHARHIFDVEKERSQKNTSTHLTFSDYVI